MSTPDLPQQPHDQPAAPHPAAQQPPQPQSVTQQPPHAPAPPAYGQAATPKGVTTLDKTNTFAFLSIILAFLAPIAGIVFGHMGLSQIKRNGDGGRGIALTGLIIGYASFVLTLVLIIAYIGFLFVIFGAIGSGLSDTGWHSDYSSNLDFIY